MSLIVIEIILWAALIFFFWALRDNLGNVERELHDAQSLKQREIATRAMARRFVSPERVGEPIGQYRDVPIHASVTHDDVEYRFDYVCPPELVASLRPDQCYVKPGIVYSRGEALPGMASGPDLPCRTGS